MEEIIKVLFVHNYYQMSGGEDKVVEEEISLLQQNGIEVSKYFISNYEIKLDGLINKVKLGLNTIWAKNQYKKLKDTLIREKPDVVHFHNTFPLFSPSVYYACKDLGIPVVQTLHNYRLACPGAMLLRNGEVCEKCITGSLINSIKHGCYRNSRIQTIPLSTMLATHRLLDTWNKKVDKYIALTHFAKGKFAENDLDVDKITVKPNFIQQTAKMSTKENKENRIVFVGRLSKEKGLHLLLKAWSNVNAELNAKLDIIGDGPLKEELEAKYGHLNNIEFHGKMNSNDVLGYMSKSKYVVVPSIWYEGFPMTIVEAYSVNTPVIASNIGSLKEVVIDEVTGFHFENNNVNDLEKVLKKAVTFSKYSEMQGNVKRQFEANYTATANFKMLYDIYEEVIGRRKVRNNPFAYVLHSKITALSFKDTVKNIVHWVDTDDKHKYVCVCNTHSLVTASNDKNFNNVLDNASICTPDGMPLVWALREFGFKDQDRVDGPNLMLKLCEESAKKRYKIFLYGDTKETLDRLEKKLNDLFAGINIVGVYSPPFRPLNKQETLEIQNYINETKADIVFVSLGCPKQEKWMYENSSMINGVLLGVGAAFNFIIGDIKRPPIMFQKLGLEWLFRLLSEPQRLWKRYLYNNTVYIYKFVKTYNKNRMKTKTTR
ncbi:WecB/TagA/CpsF family glycosyltransferase [Bacillus sp. EB93]|nr:WecB/TagA/CpsF family glycosyltransferase [Peribacillus frigoritolerans]